jgi:transcriptional regulator with XRE-family HTH domain
MITEFGKQIRKYRIDKVVTLRSMADDMGLSAAYLSAVETGKRNITTQLFDSIVDYFKLDEQKRKELRKLADLSQKEISISMENATDKHRNSAAVFARRLNELSFDDLEKINKILEG